MAGRILRSGKEIRESAGWVIEAGSPELLAILSEVKDTFKVGEGEDAVNLNEYLLIPEPVDDSVTKTILAVSKQPMANFSEKGLTQSRKGYRSNITIVGKVLREAIGRGDEEGVLLAYTRLLQYIYLESVYTAMLSSKQDEVLLSPSYKTHTIQRCIWECLPLPLNWRSPRNKLVSKTKHLLKKRSLMNHKQVQN